MWAWIDYFRLICFGATRQGLALEDAKTLYNSIKSLIPIKLVLGGITALLMCSGVGAIVLAPFFLSFAYGLITFLFMLYAALITLFALRLQWPWLITQVLSAAVPILIYGYQLLSYVMFGICSPIAMLIAFYTIYSPVFCLWEMIRLQGLRNYIRRLKASPQPQPEYSEERWKQ